MTHPPLYFRSSQQIHPSSVVRDIDQYHCKCAILQFTVILHVFGALIV